MPHYQKRFATLALSPPMDIYSKRRTTCGEALLFRRKWLWRWRLLGAIGPLCNAAQRGRTFRAGTRVFDGYGPNVLQPSVLCSVIAPAFCFAEWNMRRDVH